jgi:Fe-S oxidoreductase
MYHPFVLPFFIGFVVMGAILLVRFYTWLRGILLQNGFVLMSRIFSVRTLRAVGEVIRESLLHLKIYKVNPMLGFMHMSLAFGWFLLIAGGKLETWYYTGNFANPLWYAIFFRYFEPVTVGFWMNGVMVFFMEFALAMVLTGLSIAIVKRVYMRVVGMSNTTVHSFPNRMALFFLWLIFPLRLFAESATSGIHGGGGFLTGSVGNLMDTWGVAEASELPLWWAYSSALGLFFLALPFSRYLHIPAEMGLLFFRHWGIADEPGFHPDKGIQALEVHSCPGCGVCLDVCPGMHVGEVAFQATSFIKQVRSGSNIEKEAGLCLNCGACKEVCPVGIDIERLRLDARSHLHKDAVFSHAYLPGNMMLWRESTEVILYTGCMGRVNPKTTLAVKSLLNEAGVPFVHLDEDESVCCGRPMSLAGAKDQTLLMIEHNRDKIHGQNGKVLVTTCPICYVFFKTEYNLNIPVMHHSQFLWGLMEEGKLSRSRQEVRYAYHDPCELGRSSGCYVPPRNLLKAAGNLVSLSREKSKALCCGNNLGSLSLSEENRQSITAKTLQVLTESEPDVIVTSCPVCKHTLSKQSNVPVKDLAEILVQTHPKKGSIKEWANSGIEVSVSFDD